MINKLRALCSWYTKGLDNGSHLRIQINAAESLDQLRAIIERFFQLGVMPGLKPGPALDADHHAGPGFSRGILRVG